MAPSPNNAANRREVINYADSWRAIMHLVRSGHSWSGHERNCVFLNLGVDASSADVARFGDGSSVSGLDFADDGRALAIVDWDHDGDLDVWLRNRSAPRLRLMQNRTDDLDANSTSVAILLTGTTSNRDAIGARARLTVKSADGSVRQLVRSVHAGDAFLSQSSRWLHFGINRGDQVEQLEVHWPGKSEEQIAGVDGPGRYRVRQGSGQAAALSSTPRAVALTATDETALAPTAAARVVLSGKVPLPTLEISNDQGDTKPLPLSSRPTLLVCWLTTCPNCLQELQELAQQQSLLADAGLQVITLCVDEIPEASQPNSAAADTLLKSLNVPFASFHASGSTMTTLQHLQQALFSRYPEPVVPLSMLIDADGNLVSIYRGAFPPTTFAQDFKLTLLSDETLRSIAPPFPGTWLTKPATHLQVIEYIGARWLGKDPAAAINYYKQARDDGFVSDESEREQLTELINRLESRTKASP